MLASGKSPIIWPLQGTPLRGTPLRGTPLRGTPLRGTLPQRINQSRSPILWMMDKRTLGFTQTNSRPKFVQNRQNPVVPPTPYSETRPDRKGIIIFPLIDKLTQLAILSKKLSAPKPGLLNRPLSSKRSIPRVVHDLPIPTRFWTISGLTKDVNGAILGNCTLELFETATDRSIEKTTSNASGYYYFKGPANTVTHYVVAYKAGSPDQAGTSVNTLVGI